MTAAEAIKKAKRIIAKEGLDYAVRHYCTGEEFSGDPELVKLWDAASEALNNLTAYVDFDD